MCVCVKALTKVTPSEEVNMGDRELCWGCGCPFLGITGVYSLLSHAGISEFSLQMGPGWAG